ncbi:MAG: hypothetical protein GX835_04180 [Desulfobulbaceae bacterium]|nr:hypothetical protein [Desulfobulbaceae bacterium]
MKTNAMRTPLIKAGVVLLVFVLLAYLTSASPEGGVLDSVGLIIIGAFRLVQWAIAMIIGVAVCIAFLIGVFLFAVSLYDREAARSCMGRRRRRWRTCSPRSLPWSTPCASSPDLFPRKGQRLRSFSRWCSNPSSRGWTPPGCRPNCRP